MQDLTLAEERLRLAGAVDHGDVDELLVGAEIGTELGCAAVDLGAGEAGARLGVELVEAALPPPAGGRDEADRERKRKHQHGHRE